MEKELDHVVTPPSHDDTGNDQATAEKVHHTKAHVYADKLNKKAHNLHKKVNIHSFINVLLMIFGVNLSIGALFFVLISSFKTEVEHFLFPSVSRIPFIKTELERVHLLHEERGKQLTDLSLKTNSEIIALKESVQALSEEVKTLKGQLQANRQPAMAPVPSTELGVSWHALLVRVQKGESFEKELHALKPYMSTNKDLLLAVHPLVDCASRETRTFDVLVRDLRLIKEQLTQTSSVVIDWNHASWWEVLWYKIKRLVRFERMDMGSVASSDPTKKATIIASIDRALDFIERQEFDKAIKEIRIHEFDAKPVFDQWLVEADARLSLQQKIDHLQRHIEPLLMKGAG
jgi:hypothetical protein